MARYTGIIRRTVEYVRTFDAATADDARLSGMVLTAINRKAGLPDSRGRRDTPDYRRALLQDRIDVERARQRVRVYQFRTPEYRRAAGHLLSTRGD